LRRLASLRVKYLFLKLRMNFQGYADLFGKLRLTVLFLILQIVVLVEPFFNFRDPASTSGSHSGMS
jgi:hypothetical protein